MVTHQFPLTLPRPLLGIYPHEAAIFKSRSFQSASVWNCCFYFKILLEIKKQEVTLSISRRKGIINKHLCQNFFKKIECLFISRDSNIEEGD